MINPSDVLINVQVTSEDRQFQSTVTVADKRYASSEWYEPVTCLENKWMNERTNEQNKQNKTKQK